jgi:ribosomal protein L24E
MHKKCAVCGRRVYPGTGTYYAGRLVHRSCLGIAKIQRYKLYKKKKPKKRRRKK